VTKNGLKWSEKKQKRAKREKEKAMKIETNKQQNCI